jgi:GNAT superfamily N-acetyltransferase
MGVKEKYQRKGIGKALLEWLVKESKRIGLMAITVETLPDEDDYAPYKLTRNFYYKNGFERIAYEKARRKGWDDQIVMERKLIG